MKTELWSKWQRLDKPADSLCRCRFCLAYKRGMRWERHEYNGPRRQFKRKLKS